METITLLPRIGKINVITENNIFSTLQIIARIIIITGREIIWMQSKKQRQT